MRKATISFLMSVRPSLRVKQLGSHCTDFHEVSYLRIFRESVAKIQFLFKSNKNNRYFTWRQYTFSIISRSSLLRMTNISDKSCRETRNTHSMFNNIFFLRKSCPNETLWKNVRPGMRIARWIPKATKTHSQYVTLIAFFHCINGYMYSPHCYVICTLLVFSILYVRNAFTRINHRGLHQWCAQ